MPRRPGYLAYEPQQEPMPWGPNIWTVNGPEVGYRLAGLTIPCPTRMTLVQLGDGGVWVHSPTARTAELTAAVDRIGPVTAIIAPNTLHHTFTADWARAYPEAAVFGPEGLERHLPGLSFRVLGPELAAGWRDDIDLHVVRLGTFAEVVFFHRRSRSLVVTDLMQNFEPARVRSPLARLLLVAGGATGPNGRPSIEIRMAASGHGAALRVAADAVTRTRGDQYRFKLPQLCEFALHATRSGRRVGPQEAGNKHHAQREQRWCARAPDRKKPRITGAC